MSSSSANIAIGTADARLTAANSVAPPGTSNVVLLCAAASVGGFLFGFDSAVINGTTQALAAAFGSGTAGTGFSVASMLLGAAVGAFYAGQIADRIGRKPTMLLTASLFALGALGTALSQSAAVFMAFRIVGGIGMGASSVIGPAYIAEISPAHLRGRLGTMQQLAIVCGILVAFVSNYAISAAAGSPAAAFWMGAEAWRWMFAVQLVPSAIYALAVFTIPESPRYLVARGLNAAAESVLRRLKTPDAAQKVAEIRATLTNSTSARLADILSPRTIVMPLVWVGIVLATMQQFVGINVVFYYGAVLWQAVGFTEDQSMLINVLSGVVNVATTVLGMAVIDRFGRKPVLLVGSAGMLLTLGTLGAVFAMAPNDAAGNPMISGAPAVISLLAANLYVVFFGFSWGPIVWVMVSEMFPNRIRGISMSLCLGLHWLANFSVVMTFPVFLRTIGLASAYGIYATMALISFIFVAKVVRETRGIDLEAVA